MEKLFQDSLYERTNAYGSIIEIHHREPPTWEFYDYLERYGRFMKEHSSSRKEPEVLPDAPPEEASQS